MRSNQKCSICNREDSHYSTLFDENLCDECVEWALKYNIIDMTKLEEQYKEYLLSFPMNDPRD